jgi:molybdopterin synthase sulfur carrier subunit
MEWRLFADLADITGARRVTQTLPGTAPYTVSDAIDDLLTEYPALEERVFDESDELYNHINILKNGRDISNIDGMETQITDDDELAVFPPVSGG